MGRHALGIVMGEPWKLIRYRLRYDNAQERQIAEGEFAGERGMALCQEAMRDLRRTCIHEYAHWAVARHFGAAGFVTIVGSRGGSPGWGGRFQMHGDLADEDWRIVALAGVVAECVDDDPGIAAADIVAALRQDPARLSAVDAQLALGFGDDDVERCLCTVRAVWQELAQEAEERAACVAAEATA